MIFQVSSGKIQKPQKVLIYGTEGVGKTTLAAQFPSPLFIDIEGGSGHLDVNRLPQPDSWSMLLDEIRYIYDCPAACGGTLVIDTLDWAQQLCAKHICAQHDGVNSIEDFGYGRGYAMVYEEFSSFINLLSEICNKGLNVLCLAHAYVGRREIPSETGLYDCWTTKLDTGKRSNISAMVREWADAVLFCDFKTIVTVQNEKTGKAKAQGGQRRVIHTTHHAAWDAKNRWGLPDEIPMEYAQLAPFIPVPSFATEPLNKVPLEEEPIIKQPQTPPPVEHASEPPFVDTQAYPLPFSATEPGSSPELDKLTRQIEAAGLTPGIVMQVLAGKGLLPANTPYEVLEKRKDIAEWIPTVFDGFRTFATEKGLL